METGDSQSNLNKPSSKEDIPLITKSRNDSNWFRYYNLKH